jgi:hypothetical protein
MIANQIFFTGLVCFVVSFFLVLVYAEMKEKPAALIAVILNLMFFGGPIAMFVGVMIWIWL